MSRIHHRPPYCSSGAQAKVHCATGETSAPYKIPSIYLRATTLYFKLAGSTYAVEASNTRFTKEANMFPTIDKV